MNTQNKFERSGHQTYFKLSIIQKINLKQFRNALNINNLLACTITGASLYVDKREIDKPRVNNGLYHHIGKNHSQYKSI